MNRFSFCKKKNDLHLFYTIYTSVPGNAHHVTFHVHRVCACVRLYKPEADCLPCSWLPSCRLWPSVHVGSRCFIKCQSLPAQQLLVYSTGLAALVVLIHAAFCTVSRRLMCVGHMIGVWRIREGYITTVKTQPRNKCGCHHFHESRFSLVHIIHNPGVFKLQRRRQRFPKSSILWYRAKKREKASKCCILQLQPMSEDIGRFHVRKQAAADHVLHFIKPAYLCFVEGM